MKTKILIIVGILIFSISIFAQEQQLVDENSNTWVYLETARGEEWDNIFFANGLNPWLSAHYNWWSYKRIYIYYRQIGNKMILRVTPDFNNTLYNVQSNPYYGTNDRYGRNQFEYRVQISMSTVYFNL